jgi:hypothetical protein
LAVRIRQRRRLQPPPARLFPRTLRFAYTGRDAAARTLQSRRGMTTQTTLATCTLLSMMTLAVSSASAQAAPAAVDPEAVSATAAPPRHVGADDPNVDRGFLLPTAMTQPAGSVTYNNYELLLHGLSFGITDNVQASVTVLSPIVQDMPFVGFGAIKAHLPVGERLHLAVQGSAGFGHAFGGSEEADVYTLGAGAFASVCLREDCSSLASGSVTYQMGFARGSGSSGGYLIIYGGSIVHRVTPHVKLLLEITSAAAGGSNTETDNMPGFLAGYGVRFHTANIAADVGFVRPFGEDSSEFLMGLPFASVSYRWQ